MNRLPVNIYRALWVVEMIAAAAALDWTSMGAPVLLLFWSGGFAFSLFEGFHHAGQAQVPAKQWSDGAAVCGLVFFLFSLLRGEILTGLIFMLLFVVMAQNFLLSQTRHIWIALTAALIVLLSGAAESKSSGFLLLILLFSLAATFLMVAVENERMRGQAGSGLIDKDGSGIPTNIVLLTLLIVGVAGSFFLAFPQLPPANIGAMRSDTGKFYESKEWEEEAFASQASPVEKAARRALQKVGQFSPPEQENGADARHQDHGGNDGSRSFSYRGFGEQFNIEEVGQAHLSNRIVLYMQADEPVYLRMNAFDYFDGLRWQKRLKGLKKHRLKSDELRLLPEAKKREIRQSITLETDLNTSIPAAGRPALLSFPANAIGEDAYGLLQSPQPLKSKTRYMVVSQRDIYRERSACDDDPGDRDLYLQLPSSLDPRIVDLAAEITKGLEPSDAAFALEHHLRSAYRYTLETVISSQGITPLGEFLFERRAGHCEYFASALAIMLRTVGIPSRLVTGFSATNQNPVTGYYEVRGIDAHAWVEAYLEGIGWVTLEPTPAYKLPETPRIETTATAISDYLDQLAHQSEMLGQNEGEMQVWRALKRLGESLREGTFTIYVWLRDLLAGLWRDLGTLIVILAIAAAGVAGSWFLFRRQILDASSYLRIRYRPLGTPELAVIRIYLAMEEVLARKGLGRSPDETVEDYLTRIEQKGTAFPPIRDLGDLFLEVRYGNKTVTTEEAILARQWFISAFKDRSGRGLRDENGMHKEER